MLSFFIKNTKIYNFLYYGITLLRFNLSNQHFKRLYLFFNFSGWVFFLWKVLYFLLEVVMDNTCAGHTRNVNEDTSFVVEWNGAYPFSGGSRSCRIKFFAPSYRSSCVTTTPFYMSDSTTELKYYFDSDILPYKARIHLFVHFLSFKKVYQIGHRPVLPYYFVLLTSLISFDYLTSCRLPTSTIKMLM